ncbi:glycerol kinase GlpK [Nitrosospira sp. Is2]|uniref:glycerol kinase GlpK n=1 Tax=Nitrosospira sp. Is2 TaxID=3080532 RepID=UPI002952FD03|nr:glycerol kinase GlpK [Nitrosospira sp. Is2]WON74743.1 glycerol kinase GlpK [Nitrosospira sp. Is2]
MSEPEFGSLARHMSYILALDAGTTSVRAIIFDYDGRICGLAQKEIQQIFPHPGWVEHDPQEILQAQVAVAEKALDHAGIRPHDVAGVGIANQRETSIVWDRATGDPVYNAIVWQDRRTAQMCDKLRDAGHEGAIQQLTGLILDPYFSATKIAWILDNVAGARAQADAGRLICGTVDTWLIWKLTGNKKIHVTDPSNASRTMLFNIHGGKWDPGLLELFRIPQSMLPTVRSSSEVYGEIDAIAGLSHMTVAGAAGDQQAALFGQMCVRPGLAKNTYGTGCFLLQNIGTQAVASTQRLLTTAACKIGEKQEFALEGSVFVGGAVVQWLRDGLRLVRSAQEMDVLAASVTDSGGVVLVPAFTGLGAPHWDPYARGMLIGLTRDTSAAHVARAALEGIAFQVADLVDAMRADTGTQLKELRVDGAASRSDPLLQFQADLLGVPVVRPAVVETTALGAAYLAGLAVGFWQNTDSIATHWQIEKVFHPHMPLDRVAELRGRWKEALSRAKNWENKGEKPRSEYR